MHTGNNLCAIDFCQSSAWKIFEISFFRSRIEGGLSTSGSSRNDLVAKDLTRNTVRNALCEIRRIFNEAIEAGIVEVNPAARLGRFTRTAKTAAVTGISLMAEAEQFLQAAKEICSEYHPLFLMALRAGLRRGTGRRAVGRHPVRQRRGGSYRLRHQDSQPGLGEQAGPDTIKPRFNLLLIS
jgi:hypothetical protein